jgi:hypothetical protein
MLRKTLDRWHAWRAARRVRAIRARNARVVAASRPTHFWSFEEVPQPAGTVIGSRRIRVVKRKLSDLRT